MSQKNLEYEHIPCAVCGKDNARIEFKIRARNPSLSIVWMGNISYETSQTETIVRCNNCGLVYVDPRVMMMPGWAGYSAGQELNYFQSTRSARLEAYDELVSKFPVWLGRRAKTVLDIGCGDGVLLEAARQNDIAGIGTEVSERLIRLVRERLGDNSITSKDLSELPESSYDVITLINVVEHLTNPSQVLKGCMRLLKEDGILIIHVPNLDGLPARILGARWYQIEPLGHFYYFTYRTLGMLLSRTGFAPIGRFSLITSNGVKAKLHRLLDRFGIYLDNGLGVIARRAL